MRYIITYTYMNTPVVYKCAAQDFEWFMQRLEYYRYTVLCVEVE